jgi:hypothetical protein
MEQMPRLCSEAVEQLLKPTSGEATVSLDALRAKLTGKDWQSRDDVAQVLKQCLQQELDATLPDANAWTTTAKDAPEVPRVPATDGLKMLFNNVPVEFFIEAVGVLVSDKVAAVFTSGLDLLTALCDRVSRQQVNVDLGESVFPPLVAAVLEPLLFKMMDASSRVKRKATNAAMYVATFGEAAGGAGGLLVSEVAKEDTGKKAGVLPRVQLLKQLLARPSVATSVALEARAAVVESLGALLDHRSQEVRQLAVKCMVQADLHGWVEVTTFAGQLDPKSQQRRALKKVGLEPRRESNDCQITPRGQEPNVVFASPGEQSAVSPAGSMAGTGHRPGHMTVPKLESNEIELPFAEPIAEDAKEFVQPLVDMFGDAWARCWYSPQWQLRVTSLEALSPKMAALFPTAKSEDLFDALMRVLNEGLGDQVVKVYFAAGALLPQVLMRFGPILDAQLVRAHVAPLLLHLMARMGDSKETVRTKTTQTLFAVLASQAARPGMVGQLILDALAGKSELGVKGANSVHGWMCRLSVLRDLVRDYDVCSDIHQAQDWIPALVPGVNHGSVSVRHAAIQLFVQVYRRCTTEVDGEQEKNLEAAKEEWVRSLPTQVQQKLKRVLFEDADKENERPLEEVAKPAPTPLIPPRKNPFNCPKILGPFARKDPSELDVFVPMAAPEKVVTAIKHLTAAIDWGSTKNRSDKEKGLPTDLEVFEALCEVLQLAFEVPHQAVFQASAQLCCALLHHSSVSSLDVHMSVGKIFPSLLNQTSSGNHKIAIAADKTVVFLAKHPRVGNEAVARQVLGAIARAERPSRLLGLLLRLVGEFGAYLCFQQQLVALMFTTCAPLLLATQDNPETQAVRSQIAELVQRCQQLQPRIAASCLRELDGPSRQAYASLDTKKGGELLLIRDDDKSEASPVKPKRASRYRKEGKEQSSSRDFSEGWNTPELGDRNWDVPVGPVGVRRLSRNNLDARPPLPPLRCESRASEFSRASRESDETLPRVDSRDINPLEMSAESMPPRLRREAKSSLGLRPEPAALKVDGLDVLIDSLDSKERKSKTR